MSKQGRVGIHVSIKGGMWASHRAVESAFVKHLSAVVETLGYTNAKVYVGHGDWRTYIHDGTPEEESELLVVVFKTWAKWTRSQEAARLICA